MTPKQTPRRRLAMRIPQDTQDAITTILGQCACDSHWTPKQSPHSADPQDELTSMLRAWFVEEQAVVEMQRLGQKRGWSADAKACYHMCISRQWELLGDLSPAARELLDDARVVHLDSVVYRYEPGRPLDGCEMLTAQVCLDLGA